MTTQTETDSSAQEATLANAASISFDGETDFDRFASTWTGANVSALLGMLLLPFYIIVMGWCALRSLAGLFGISRTSTTEDNLTEGTSLEEISKYLKLDDLTNRTLEELDYLFKLGTTPSLDEMDGNYAGAQLTGPDWPLNNLDNLKLINQPLTMWQGKAFQAVTANTGIARNRVAVGPLKFLMSPILTSIEASDFCDKQVLRLNYGVDGNPGWSSGLRDDLVKLKDGLFLGRATWKGKKGDKFLMYFALRCITK